MAETMCDYEGIGLAAPQIFSPLRLILVDGEPADEDEPSFTVIANPRIVESSSDLVEDWEGCLSIPDLRGLVPRLSSVVLRGLARDGSKIEQRSSGLTARVIQHEVDHEVDHLDGVLFIDRMSSLESLSFLEEHRRFSQQDQCFR